MPQADSTPRVCEQIRVPPSRGQPRRNRLRAVWLPGAVTVLLGIGLTAGGGRPIGVSDLPRGDGFDEDQTTAGARGTDFELVSWCGMGGRRIEATELPSRLRFKFYLDEHAVAYATVRELDYRHLYWLDNVEPSAPWRAGFGNGFAWPTNEVLRRLDHILMYDLGVVVRLDAPEARSIERVAPAIFYHTDVPATVEGYLFTFRTSGNARVTCTIYAEPPSDALFTRTIPRQPGGRPFTIRWDSTRRSDGTTGALPAAPGWYSLVVIGYFLDTNDPISQTTRFYHQPTVQ